MPHQRTRIVIAVAIGCSLLAAVANACPYCKVTRDELGILDIPEANVEAASQPAKEEGLRFGFSADVASGYFHHGYMMQDRGLAFQPAIAVSTQPIVRGDWVFEPYLVWTNTFNTEESPGYAGGHDGHSRTEQKYEQYLDEPHAGNPLPHYHSRLVDVISYDDAGGGWFESELRPGVRVSRGPLAVDLLIKGHVYPSDFHDTIIEIGAKTSYELDSLWSSERNRDFGLRATVMVTHELKDDNGSRDTIIETTLEPIYRFSFKDKRGSISAPVTLGMSPNGFYRGSDLDDELFGFVSIGIEASVPLPVDAKYGRWFLNAGVTGYQMLSDSSEFANQGEQAFVARVGVGIAF
jgi:hypothetical protein